MRELGRLLTMLCALCVACDPEIDPDGGLDAGADGGAGGCQTQHGALIAASFRACPGTSNVGQVAPAGGVTCSEVCCALGFVGCAYRAAQSDFATCELPNPARTGSCSDVFRENWSSQCVCTPPRATCGSNRALIQSAFVPCPGGSGQVGQSAPAGGVTCEEVCCTLGYTSCLGRGAQADYNACSPLPAARTGDCGDVYAANWSSQCLCQ
jgi:hypothetical protein